MEDEIVTALAASSDGEEDEQRPSLRLNARFYYVAEEFALSFYKKHGAVN